MGAFLKQAILSNVVGSIDDIVNEWIETERNKVDGEDKKEQSISSSTIPTNFNASQLPFNGNESLAKAEAVMFIFKVEYSLPIHSLV